MNLVVAERCGCKFTLPGRAAVRVCAKHAARGRVVAYRCDACGEPTEAECDWCQAPLCPWHVLCSACNNPRLDAPSPDPQKSQT